MIIENQFLTMRVAYLSQKLPHAQLKLFIKNEISQPSPPISAAFIDRNKHYLGPLEEILQNERSVS